MAPKLFQSLISDRSLTAHRVYKSALYLTYCITILCYAFACHSIVGLLLSFLAVVMAANEFKPALGLRLKIIKECEQAKASTTLEEVKHSANNIIQLITDAT